MTGPLDGLLVADFSRVLAGPFATMALADLGATVVKVEQPGVGDETRQWGPPWTHAGESSYYECVNRTKRSIALDLDAPDHLALAKQLVGRADVLVQNFRPGVMAGFGLDFESVSASNSRLVYCSISGFGESNGAEMPGYDFIIQAVGGLMSITGESDGAPQKVGVALVDVLTGKDAVIGILASLADRHRTGHGQHVRVDLLSSLLGALVNQAAATLTTGKSPTRMGNRHPSIAPYQTVRCRGGTLALACGNDRQFARLARAVDRPDLASDDRFATNAARIANLPALITELELALAMDSPLFWVEKFNRAGLAAGLVGDIASAIDLADSLNLMPVIHLPGGHPPQIRHPVRYSRTHLVPPTPPPALDADRDLIRAWLASDGTETLPDAGRQPFLDTQQKEAT